MFAKIIMMENDNVKTQSTKKEFSKNNITQTTSKSIKTKENTAAFRFAFKLLYIGP